MTPKPERETIGPRDLALKILKRVQQSNGYADRVLETELNRFPLSDQDRSLTTELVYGTLRWQGRLDRIIRRLYHGDVRSIPDSILTVLRLGLYQILFLNRIPSHAAVNESVRLAKLSAATKWGNVVNGMLRTYLRNPESVQPTITESDPVETIAGWMSHPAWLIRRWLEEFGFNRTVQICEANNQRPPIGLRINRMKTNPDEIAEELDDQGIDYQYSEFVPDWLAVRKFGPAVRQLLNNGLVSVQDGSAALVARLIDPQPDECILDMAAAPGGKCSHMAELSGDTSTIVAADRHVSRVRKMNEGFRRLGIRNVHPVTADSRRLPILKADKILLDAPCSGMGVIRRRVELRWRMEEEEIQNLVILQRALLEEAYAILNSNGVLVYSTCTVCHEENKEMIEWFLNKHPECEIEPADGRVSKSVISDYGSIETWPDQHGLDGSFAIRMRKMR